MIARRPPVMKIRSKRRYTFVLVLTACWFVGVWGLDGGRLASFPLILVAVIGFVALGVAGVHRRRVELLRERVVPGAELRSRNCIVLGPFGEHAERSTWSRN